MPVHPVCLLDATMAQYLDALCYERRAPLSRGVAAYWGLIAMYPGVHLPEALRALRSWEALAPGSEGLPVAAEILM
eukprot:8853967-Alexandrium_andersonii.AAC.1